MLSEVEAQAREGTGRNLPFDFAQGERKWAMRRHHAPAHQRIATTLAHLYARAGVAPRDGLRRSEPAAAALADADDKTILAAMAANSALIERPLVETDRGVVLARPPELLHAIL